MAREEVAFYPGRKEGVAHLVLLGETLVLPGETLVLLGETLVLLGETLVLPGETVVLSGETLVWPGETLVWLGETPVEQYVVTLACVAVGAPWRGRGLASQTPSHWFPRTQVGGMGGAWAPHGRAASVACPQVPAHLRRRCGLETATNCLRCC